MKDGNLAVPRPLKAGKILTISIARTAALLLAFLFAVSFARQPALAEEVIRSFTSDVIIGRDATIEVTETIAVVAEGAQIKRGILRDFPTRYKTPDGKDYEVGFRVLSITRDGVAEAWIEESLANGIRLKIGRADVLIEPGLHTYAITYRATGELGFFEGYDEIYWNVTGNSWTFPIERADTIIRLPDGAEVLQHAAYTGPFGAQGRDVAVIAAKGSLYRAETTRRLEAGEGFTVAVGFTKGIVTPPAPPPDYTVTSYYVLGGGVLFMALYYMLTWLRVGRDPSGGPVIPRWHPPEGLEPAGVRYIWTRAYDEKSFAAALIGLAAKGLLRITHGEHYEIARTGGDKSGLTLTEKKLLSYVPKTLQVKRGNAGALDLMWSTLRHHTTTDFDRPTLLRNRKWFWLGILLSFLVLVASLIFVRPEEFTVALIVVYICGAIWALALWLLFMGFRMFRTSWFLALLLLAICVPLMALGLLFPPALVMGFSGPTLWIYMAALAALAAMHILFARLLSAPTVLGAKLKAEVEGLRLYMTTAEEHRLNLLNPPDKTPELFERLLPYALALDCENRWSDKFASVLEAARYTGPTWYQGASLLSDMSDFSRTLDDNRHAPSPGGSSGSSSSFSTSSSSWSPGSSSGSSGGGSSGGGGGGGGGSGW